MDKILLKWPRLTTAQVILGLTLFIAIWLGFLTADIQYNRQLSMSNQKSILDLVNDAIENQNRTRTLMPSFIGSIHDTHKVAEFMPTLINVVNRTAQGTNFLAQNFGADSNYLDRENFQYHQANVSFAVSNQTLAKLMQQNEQLNLKLDKLLNSTR